ncbi:hypothetical protein MIMGU_mgv1a017221mg [Erythranthe guttata]|uniref:Uncharacterized protein n=1 Tax=Erythranthe guttata TaxID=4155 RepID=A0A022QDV4_ERYGU|nr:hypothetical protein MIMGU_mgv1a017221mg [Erythranthe guttata]
MYLKKEGRIPLSNELYCSSKVQSLGQIGSQHKELKSFRINDTLSRSSGQSFSIGGTRNPCPDLTIKVEFSRVSAITISLIKSCIFTYL